MAEAVMLYYTGPLLAVVIMHFLGERTNWARLGLAAAAFIGAVAVIKPFNISGSAGALIALASGVLYGLLIVTNKLAVKSLPPIRLVFYQTAIVAIVTAPFLFTTKFHLTVGGITIVLAAALVNTLFALYLWYNALKKISVNLASVLSYLDPVFATAFAYFFLGQIPSATTLLGGALIISSGVFAALLETGALSCKFVNRWGWAFHPVRQPV
ncbi:DMT family transporter [Pyrobaculum aerophilum]|uniref:DMT family transporter n=1 Tax=Pyrobaculum aerophilum TaxID=13773 RepID=UPI0021639A35|nr:DMT family transporter [Pyrobaculum aerophilum]